MPRLPYSAEVRQRAIHRVLHSRTPIAQVAREIGCTASTLHLWLNKHRQQKSQTVEPSDASTFVPINVIDSENPVAEIVIPNGLTIRLTDATPQYLAELLHALAPSC